MNNNIFKALSDPVRRKILEMLRDKDMNATEIANQFELTNATVSYHLSKLKEADLVYETKRKNYIFYSLNLTVLQDFILWVNLLKKEEFEDEK